MVFDADFHSTRSDNELEAVDEISDRDLSVVPYQHYSPPSTFDVLLTE